MTMVYPPSKPYSSLRRSCMRLVEGRVYGSIEEKVEAVNAYLSRLESDPERVRSLVGWEWIKRNVQRLTADYAASSS